MSYVTCQKCGASYENGMHPIEVSGIGQCLCPYPAPIPATADALRAKLTEAEAKCARLEDELRPYEVQQALAAEQDRNRELTRQVEQLQARVDAAEKLIKEWRKEGLHAETCVWDYCAETLAAALTAPPSSSDHGRADTGREER